MWSREYRGLAYTAALSCRQERKTSRMTDSDEWDRKVSGWVVFMPGTTSAGQSNPVWT